MADDRLRVFFALGWIGDDGAFTEASGGGYVRLPGRLHLARDMPIAYSGADSDDAPLIWPPATEAWGRISHAAAFDAETGGAPLRVWSLMFPKLVESGPCGPRLQGRLPASCVPPPLASSDFRALLGQAGVTVPWLAAQTGRSVGAVKSWVARNNAPPEVMAWLRERIANPPPRVEARAGCIVPPRR